MAGASRDITFLVPGTARARAAAGPAVRGSVVKASVTLAATRAEVAPQRVVARSGEDVVVLTIADGPQLVLHPEDARDLLLAQQVGPTRSARAAGGGIVVSAQLAWPGLEAAATRGTTRGWMGQAVLKALDVVTGLVKDPAAQLAAALVTQKVDGQVDAGVYELSADPLPTTLKGSGRKRDQVAAGPDGAPSLVLLHGTFVDTVSTFGKLWTLHRETVKSLFARYHGRVYALDHPTVGTSPIANALTLVAALPAGARLHLLTHSRGGLVAEALVRACRAAPPGEEELAPFAGNGYAQHRRDLEALARLARAKRIAVERVVRVACPARGTLLASKRLDAYLSVLQWGLQLAGVPVAPQLVDFLHEVARRRADPAELPGLEAMLPDSGFIGWIGSASAPIASDLRVVAGDLAGDSVGSWVKTLLADAFYWTDNDLVVQTRSMYGGAPRDAAAGGRAAEFLLDRGAKVTHFNYFANPHSVDAILHALVDAEPAGFAPIGPLSWAGEDASGVRAARAVARSRAADARPDQRPAVFVLPGILGSNLKLDGRRIWLASGFVNGLQKLAWDPASAARFEPDGPIGASYAALIEHLAASHEVIPFAYDWRRPIEDEARRLADAVEVALDARTASGAPVRLIAHSMGGLVARALQLERPATWQRLMAHDGARLVMLGTPNAGSWSPMQTLSGDDTFGNALVAFGSILDNAGARQTMAGMPGFLQLQAALLDPALRLDRASSWQALADEDIRRLRELAVWHDEGPQRTIYEWGAPPQRVLDQAVALRRRLDAQLADLASAMPKILLVAGRAPFTPAGFRMAVDGLEYLDAPEGGDGRVLLSSAWLPGVKAWRVDATHGGLPEAAGAYAAYVELLENGDTRLLDRVDADAVRRTRPAIVSEIAAPRGAADAGKRRADARAAADAGSAAPGAAAQPLVPSRPSRGLLPSEPPASAADIQSPARTPAAAIAARAGAERLRVSVVNGDLRFIHQPLVLGHYRALKLTGTEAVVDRLVGGAMQRSLEAGLYPDAPGAHQIFGNARPDPENALAMARPKAAIVAGLGAEGKLRASELVYTVRQAVIAYAQRVAEEQQGAAAEFELAATLLGSGGTGISAGTAAQLIAQGTLEANLKLAGSKWPQVGRLVFTELYLERASDAWRALQLQAAATPRLEVVGKVESSAGALRRSLDASYRGTDYDFISALQVASNDPKRACIAYNLDTKRARTEVRAMQAQGTLLRELIDKASNDANRDPQIGRTLFNLLVPVEMEPFLAGSSEMLIELEPETAGIPWEMLDNDVDTAGGGEHRPWSIRSKLLRKLRTADFRAQTTDATADDSVLVIGEPQCNPNVYPPLPGARAEAEAVVRLLTAPERGIDAERVRDLIGGCDARTVINALFERAYRVVHVAGHGAPGANGGVVLSGEETFLGANEVRAMRTIPELVFLNCCHLAGREAGTVLLRYDRAAFAANIAEALIQVGVRCVIAAGWAVEDGPAETFATTFYSSLLSGERFIDAVAAARLAAWNENRLGNTWAAYQCYGDPDWTWTRGVADSQEPTAPRADSYAAIASPVGLAIALETLAVQSQYDSSGAPRRLEAVRGLDAQFAPLWGSMGAVAEAFGVAYAECGEVDEAIAWYRSAVDAGDGSASFRAAEQLGNLLARRGGESDDVEVGRRDIDEGIDQLMRVAALQPTFERQNLLASAYKRRVMLETHAGDEAAALEALEQMVVCCQAAEALATSRGSNELYYPAKNAISAELRLAFLRSEQPHLDAERIAEVRRSLEAAATQRPDFWSVVGPIELEVLTAIVERRLASALPELLEEFEALKARVPAVAKWDSVHAQAQFTLEPYQRSAAGEEKRAVDALLAALARMAELESERMSD